MKTKKVEILYSKDKRKVNEFMSEIQIILINIQQKKDEIDEKLLEIIEAKKTIKDSKELINNNKQDIINLNTMKKQFEEDLVKKQDKIINIENEQYVLVSKN